MNLEHQMMKFRTTYIQCIAKSWNPNNSDFTSNLVNKYEMGGENKDSLTMDVAFNQLQMASGVYNALPEVSDKYRNQPCNGLLGPEDSPAYQEFMKYLPGGEHLPWRINVYLLDNMHLRYNPFVSNFRNGWVGPCDVFVVRIPNRPPLESDFDEALVAFYGLFTTMFGSDLPDGPHKFSNPVPTIGDIANYVVPFSLNGDQYGAMQTEDLQSQLGVGGAEDFLAFQSRLIEMIAQAWSNADYFRYLTGIVPGQAAKGGEFGAIITPVGTPQSQYSDRFISFENPWAFNIVFAPSPESKWENGAWSGLQYNQIFLNYPQPPVFEDKIGPHHRAVALARYNGTGPAYPFSCT